jgi:hypothetical protein
MQHWKRSDCFLPLIVTVLVSWLWYVEITVTIFFHLILWQKQVQNAAIWFHLFFKLCVFHFYRNILFGQFQCTNCLSWLKMVNYRNYPFTVQACFRRGSTSLKKWLLFYWCQLWSRGTQVLYPCLYIQGRTINTLCCITQLISFNSKFGCLERQVLFEIQAAFPNCQWFLNWNGLVW